MWFFNGAWYIERSCHQRSGSAVIWKFTGLLESVRFLARAC